MHECALEKSFLATHVGNIFSFYAGDTLCVSEIERKEHIIWNEIGAYFELKEESTGALNIYLGGKLQKVVLQNGIHAWAFCLSQYGQEVVQNVEKYLAFKGESLPKKTLLSLIKWIPP